MFGKSFRKWKCISPQKLSLSWWAADTASCTEKTQDCEELVKTEVKCVCFAFLISFFVFKGICSHSLHILLITKSPTQKLRDKDWPPGGKAGVQNPEVWGLGEERDAAAEGDDGQEHEGGDPDTCHTRWAASEQGRWKLFCMHHIKGSVRKPESWKISVLWGGGVPLVSANFFLLTFWQAAFRDGGGGNPFPLAFFC